MHVVKYNFVSDRLVVMLVATSPVKFNKVKVKRMEEEKCEVHQNPLTIWCTTDGFLVCYACLLFGEHRGHQYLDEEKTK